MPLALAATTSDMAKRFFVVVDGDEIRLKTFPAHPFFHNDKQK
jgi:hypothetical protein